MNDSHRKRDHCRACGGTSLARFLELGPQPLANAFPRVSDEFENEGFFPLDVYFCGDCSLVQLLDVIDPELLFGSYIYVSVTQSSRCTALFSWSRISSRAALPTFFKILPPLPTTMPFWLSRSTQIIACIVTPAPSSR